MPSIQEAADQLGKDLITQNMASLMMALTPEGMMKAMALQGQMMAAQQAAAAAGLPPPAPATAATADVKGQEGEDQLVELSLHSADGVAVVQTRWRELAGVWKVNDFLLLRVIDKDGNPVALPTVPGVTAPGVAGQTLPPAAT
jgi:hypothetical protein